MKKTSINLTQSQITRIDEITEKTKQDRSQIIRDLLDGALWSDVYEPQVASRDWGSRVRINRLTESAPSNFITTQQEPIAYTYTGAVHYLEKDKEILLATQLYSQNPLAHRIIEIIADFCVGESGITWDTEFEDLNDVLTRFWNGPRNPLSTTQHRRTTEFLLYGEQCYPTFVNPDTGLVQLGNVHPAFIKQTILDPDDYGFVIGVEVYTNYSTQHATKRYRTICSEDPRTFLNPRALAMRNEMDGECFYFPINALTLPMTANGVRELSCQSRGRSELLPLMDRLGMLDDLNYLNLDRMQILLSIIYDITIKGGGPKDIKKVIEDFGVPTGPAVRAHDDNMSVDVKTPRLGSSDTATLFKMLEDEVLGGIGIPSQWFGDSGNANRASAMSMELPTLKKLKSRQTVVANMFKSILDYQVEQAKERGLVAQDVEYSLNVPAITRKDLSNVGDALNKAVANIEKAIASGFLTHADGGEIIREIASGYGIELHKPEGPDIDAIAALMTQVHPQKDEPKQEDTEFGESPRHDYDGQDNPEEPRDEKDERDERKQFAS